MVDTKRLKGHIASNGYTQRTLAVAIGINKNTLNAKLNRKQEFNADEIIRICDVLGIADPIEKCEIFLLSSSQ